MKPNRLAIALTGAAVTWAIASVAAMTYGTLVNVPDYVHTNFGIPFIFAIHTTSTLAGPINAWAIDLGALAMDLVFWLGGVLAILLINVVESSRAIASAKMGLN